MRSLFHLFPTLFLALSISGTQPAGAITIDEFTSALPAPGAVESGPGGSGSVSQNALPGVLGGSRVTEVLANVPGLPTSVVIEPNATPPPTTPVASATFGEAGGQLSLAYPGLSDFDMTLGGGGLTPSSVIIVRSTEMVADAALRVVLSDITGIEASAELQTVNFTGSGDHHYLYFVDAATFNTPGTPGPQLDRIDKAAVTLTTTAGQVSNLSDISVVPVAARFTNWARSFAFQAVGGFVNPAVLVGFNPQPEPPGDLSAEIDMTNPKQPRLILKDQPLDPVLEFRFAAYGGLDTLRSTVVDGNHFEFELQNGQNYRVVIDVTSSSGQVIDPGSLVGFNPQPEPPNPGSIVGFNPQPEPPVVGNELGFEFSMSGGAAGAGPAAGGETVTLAFQILDGSGAAIDLAQVSIGHSVPFISRGLMPVLVSLLAVVASFSLINTRESHQTFSE